MPQLKSSPTVSASAPAAVRHTAGRPRRSRRPLWWLMAVVLLLCAAVVLWRLFGAPNAAPESSEEPSSEAPDPHEGEVCVSDADFGELWFPEDNGVPPHSYDWSNLVEENGFRYYQTEDFRSWIAVDVSEFQGTVDWQAVRAAGVERAVIRCGWRGYYTGNLSEDVEFRANMEGAAKAGIAVGVYFFSQATTDAEAAEEAAFVLERIADYDITMPIFFDWEDMDEADARTAGMTDEQKTACAVAFCKTIEQGGYQAGVYFYKDVAYFRYDLSRLTDYAFWLSEPRAVPTFYYDFTVWQYDIKGSVDGIEGTVDLNICFTPDGDIRR